MNLIYKSISIIRWIMSVRYDKLVDYDNTDVYNRHLIIKIKGKNGSQPRLAQTQRKALFPSNITGLHRLFFLYYSQNPTNLQVFFEKVSGYSFLYPLHSFPTFQLSALNHPQLKMLRLQIFFLFPLDRLVPDIRNYNT